MKKILFLAKSQWKASIKNIDFWVVLLCLFAFFSLFFVTPVKELIGSGQTVGICAIYPAMLLDGDFILLIFAGFLMVMSNVPVLSQETQFQVIRADRSIYYLSQIVYSIFMTMTYFLSVFILSVLFYLPVLSFNTDWGSAVYSGQAFASNGRNLFIPENLLEVSAFSAAILAFFLSVLLGLVFTLLCCLANMAGFGSVGLAICSLLLFVELICERRGMIMGMFLPVGVLKSYYGGTSVTVSFSILYYMFFFFVFVLIGFYQIQRMDLGKEQWGT